MTGVLTDLLHNYHVDWDVLLGRGSWGTVVAGVHKPSQDSVAIKYSIGEEEGERAREKREGLKHEIDIYKVLGSHTNVLSMWDSALAGNNVAIVLPRLDCDLIEYMLKHGHNSRLPPVLVRKFAWQITLGLAYIHSRDIVHRDLHTGNVLVHIKPLRAVIADFGFARCLEATCQVDKYYTLCAVQFRAPELILGKSYGQAIDVWALGCIVAHISLGVMIFGHKTDFPSEWGTLVAIASLLGTPCEATWPGVTSLPHFTAGKLPQLPSRGLLSIWTSCEAALDFTSSCLVYDPLKRMTAMHALEHKYYQTEGVVRVYALHHQHNVDPDTHPDATSACCVPFAGQVATDFLLGKTFDEFTPAYVEEDR